MRSDPKLSFSKLEKDSSFQEFPNADTITRRLKKLIQIIIKNESNGVISFEDRKNVKEPTGFTLEEKNKITSFLTDRKLILFLLLFTKGQIEERKTIELLLRCQRPVVPS